MAKKRKSAPPVEQAPKEESESEEEEVEEEEEEEGEEEEGSDEEESESESSSEQEEEEEEEDEDSKREALRGLLQPFTKDQLVNILKEAAAKNPTLVSGVIKSAETDPIQRKIFVHGLGWDTTNETLTAAFRPYGQIEECNTVLDRATGRCKGFGFVLFKTRAGARKALKEPQKKIGARMASCQLASAGPGGPPPDLSGRKLYVANVAPHVSVDKLRAFFAKFGEIEEGPNGLDKATGKFRGFAIFLYKSAEGMKKALQEPVKEFEGCKLMCSVFVEGRGGNKAGSSGQAAAPAGTGGGTTAPNSSGAQNFPSGLNQGLAGQTYPGPVLLGQNPGLGVLNPLMGNHGFPMGAPALLGRSAAANPVGGFGVQQDINSVSPSMINAYGSQAALQGMGVFQSSQLGQGSAHGSAAAAAARGQSEAGSSMHLSSYFRR
ncbi:UBP1-associated protein 2A-like [Punica granatum]|uniref:RRM domain-containing protein n=2 Tax=Punica granatum TaxID=22663 RepID=A0A218WM82_PUNGR|nr:UBP1-associated protein 2A-like [Punica granatum]OWM73579.1 hypothetical protein CDL15_Pgr026678 [Punica granatum]PKI40286.1 hypothetical protein CRG98_039311 [Punica granatum]